MEQNPYVIAGEIGIHARPATMLVQTASKFDSDIQLEYNGKRVSSKSVMGVMSLDVGRDAKITIYAGGGDESDVIQAVNDVLSKEESTK